MYLYLIYNSCLRDPTAYSFCKVFNTHFSKDYCKDSSYNANVIEKRDGFGHRFSS